MEEILLFDCVHIDENQEEAQRITLYSQDLGQPSFCSISVLKHLMGGMRHEMSSKNIFLVSASPIELWKFTNINQAWVPASESLQLKY